MSGEINDCCMQWQFKIPLRNRGQTTAESDVDLLVVGKIDQDDLDAADLSQERLHRVPEQKAHYVDYSSCPSD